MRSPFEGLEGYDYRHLARHLVAAGYDRELHQLLALVDDGVNAWFRARDARNEASAYLGDLELARQLADDAATHGLGAQATAAIGHQCRYALIRANLTDVARLIGPAVASRFVEGGLWTQEQALTYARLGGPENWFAVAVGQLPRESDERRDLLARQALTAAQFLAENVERSGDIVVRLAEALPPHLLVGVLDMLDNVDSERSRAQALKNVAPRLPPALLPRAIALARAITGSKERAAILAAIAGNLPVRDAHELWKEAITAARASDDPAAVLADLMEEAPLAMIPRLSAVKVDGDQALVAIGRYAEQEPMSAWESLQSLGHHATSPRYSKAAERVAVELARAGLAEQAVAAATTLPAAVRGPCLARLAPLVFGETRWRLFDEATRLDWKQRIDVLEALVRDADADLATSILNAVVGKRGGTWPTKVEALSKIATSAPPVIRADALLAAAEAALAEGDNHSLQRLAPHLPMDLASAGLARLTRPDSREESSPYFEDALGAVAVRVAELGAPAAALDAVLSVRAEGYRARSLAIVAPALPTDLLPSVRSAFEPPSDDIEWIAACNTIGDSLSRATREEVHRRAVLVEDPSDRIMSLLGVSIWLGKRERSLAITEALRAVPQVRDPVSAMERLLDRLPAGLIGVALEAAEEISDFQFRIPTLAAIAKNLRGREAACAWRRTLASVARLTPKQDQAAALVWLASELPAAYQEELLDLARRHRESVRAEILARVAPRLLPSLRRRAIAEARQISRQSRFFLLRLLLRKYDRQTQADVVGAEYAALESDPDAYRQGWLHAAATELGRYDRSSARRERTSLALNWARSRRTSRERSAALAALCGALRGRRAEAIASEALTEATAVRNADLPLVLAALSLDLPPRRLGEVVEFVTVRLRRLIAEDSDQNYRIVASAAAALGELARRALAAGEHQPVWPMIEALPDFIRGDVVAPLVSLLPPHLLADGARIVDDYDVRSAIAKRLAEIGEWEELLAVVRRIVEQYGYMRAGTNDAGALIGLLAQRAPRARLTDLLELALQLPDEDRAVALEAMVPSLPSARRRVVLETALDSSSAEMLAVAGKNAGDVGRGAIITAWTRELRREDLGRRDVLRIVRALGHAVIDHTWAGAELDKALVVRL
jgi:hypothetical protein